MILGLKMKFVKVICADVARTTELLKEKFDHIFFTGAPKIGEGLALSQNQLNFLLLSLLLMFTAVLE